MKKFVLISPIVIALTLIAVNVQADSFTIADWQFETSQPSSAGPFAPEIGSGSATGSHAGASVYSAPAGNGSNNSFSSNLWAPGDYYQFQVNTVNVSGLTFDWDEVSSGTGPAAFTFQYSTDGTTFTTFYSYTVLSTPSWSSGTPQPTETFPLQDLSAVTALNNQASVYFRLVMDTSTVSANGGAIGTAGTDRVDNVIVAASQNLANPTWTGAAGTGFWNTGTNWTGNTVPTTGQTLVFAGSTQTTTTNNSSIGNAFSVVFNSTASSFSLSGNALTIGSGGISNNSTNGQTINLPLSLSASTQFSATGDITYNGAINNNGLNLGVAGGGNSSFVGAISGTGGLSKAGAGTMALFSTVNVGPLSATAGTISIDAGASVTTDMGSTSGANWSNVNLIGSGPLHINVGSVSGVSQGSLSLGSGTDGDSNGGYHGVVHVTGAGELIVNSNLKPLGDNTLHVDTSGLQLIATSAANGILQNPVVLHGTDNSFTLYAGATRSSNTNSKLTVGPISGTGHLEVQTNPLPGPNSLSMPSQGGGGGNTILKNASTYSGDTYVNQGTTGVMQFTESGDIPSGTNVKVAVLSGTGTVAAGFGGVIDMNGTDQTIGSLTNGQGLSIVNNGANLTGLFTITTKGSGYTSTPIVSVVGGGGTGATAIATIDASGRLNSIILTNPGSGFTSAPTISVSAPDTGTAQAIARLDNTVFLDSGPLSKVAPLLSGVGPAVGLVTNSGGAGNDSTLTISGSATSGAFNLPIQDGANRLAIVRSGTGTTTLAGVNSYTNGTTVKTGSTLNIGDNRNIGDNTGGLTLDGGTLGSNNAAILSLTSAGTGVRNFPQIGIDGGIASATGYVYGEMTTVNVTTAGSGYTPNSTSIGITATGGGGTGFSAHGNSDATGKITSVTIDNAGTGYTSNPALSIDVPSAGTVGGTVRASVSINGIQVDGVTQVATGFGFSSTPTVTLITNNLNTGGTGPTITATVTNPSLDAARSVTLTSNGGKFAPATGTSLTVNSTISGPGALTMSGPGTLILNSNSDGYTGGNVVAGGTLQLGGASVLGTTPEALTVNNGGTLDLHGFSPTVNGLSGTSGGVITSAVAGAATLTIGSGNAGGTYSGSISNGSGTVSLLKIGSGTETLSGPSTFSGGTTVNGTGKITVNNPTALGVGGLALNNTAKTNIATGVGTVVLTSLKLNNGSSTPTATFDVGKNSVVIPYSGTSPFNTIRTQILQAADFGGWDQAGITDTFGDGGTFGLGYAEASDVEGDVTGGTYVNNQSPKQSGANTAIAGQAVILKHTFLGDTDLTGSVDGFDYNNLTSNFGITSGATWAQGDNDYDGTVDGFDYNNLTSNFGATGLSGGSPVPVPEPSSLVLAAFGLAGLAALARRCRKVKE